MTDFRFPLMRHWSVYESIIHSRYVAVRLGTWQEKGRDKVDELLVKMGLSQRDCKQDYCAPSPLCAHLIRILPLLGLHLHGNVCLKH